MALSSGYKSTCSVGFGSMPGMKNVPLLTLVVVVAGCGGAPTSPLPGPVVDAGVSCECALDTGANCPSPEVDRTAPQCFERKAETIGAEYIRHSTCLQACGDSRAELTACVAPVFSDLNECFAEVAAVVRCIDQGNEPEGCTTAAQRAYSCNFRSRFDDCHARYPQD